eukprot:15443583-Alexandrium_andersonii.AAC.1
MGRDGASQQEGRDARLKYRLKAALLGRVGKGAWPYVRWLRGLANRGPTVHARASSASPAL